MSVHIHGYCILKRTAHSSMVRARISEGLWKLSRRLDSENWRPICLELQSRSARVSWCLILQFISPERPWLLSWPRQRLLWIFLYFCSSWPHFKKTWDYLRFLLWTKLRWYGANATQRISIQSTDTLISSSAMVINLCSSKIMSSTHLYLIES